MKFDIKNSQNYRIVATYWTGEKIHIIYYKTLELLWARACVCVRQVNSFWGQIINGGTQFYFIFFSALLRKPVFLFVWSLPTVGRLIQTHTHIIIISNFWKLKFMIIELLCFTFYYIIYTHTHVRARVRVFYIYYIERTVSWRNKIGYWWILILKYSPITCFLLVYKRK